MIKQFHGNKARLRRHQRMRNNLAGTAARPRLSVYRSGTHIYAQIIDDVTGKTLVAASSLDASLRDFKLRPVAVAEEPETSTTEPTEVEVAAEAAPAAKGKGAKAEKQPQKAQAKGGQPQKGAPAKGGRPGTQVKILLPSAVKGQKKTPVEALAAISTNHKVAVAREVGKLVGQRAKEQGVNRVVFDRGGFAYHGRVAALAEGAREVGLEF
jgi:ribosomal protein L18